MRKDSSLLGPVKKCFSYFLQKFKRLINKSNYKKRKTHQECLIHTIAEKKTENVAIGLKSLIDGFIQKYTPIAEAKGLIFAGIYNGNDILVGLIVVYNFKLLDNFKLIIKFDNFTSLYFIVNIFFLYKINPILYIYIFNDDRPRAPFR